MIHWKLYQLHFMLLQDAAYQIKNILDEMEFDPERLNEVEHGLLNIKRLNENMELPLKRFYIL